VLSPGTVRRAGELLAHAQVEIVPGAPHSMYWETPSLFNEALGRFLADVTAALVTRTGRPPGRPHQGWADTDAVLRSLGRPS
jgi:hypothetical protein